MRESDPHLMPFIGEEVQSVLNTDQFPRKSSAVRSASLRKLKKHR